MCVLGKPYIRSLNEYGLKHMLSARYWVYYHFWMYCHFKYKLFKAKHKYPLMTVQHCFPFLTASYIFKYVVYVHIRVCMCDFTSVKVMYCLIRCTCIHSRAESSDGVQPFLGKFSLERSGDQLGLYCDDAVILSSVISPLSIPKGDIHSSTHTQTHTYKYIVSSVMFWSNKQHRRHDHLTDPYIMLWWIWYCQKV